MNQLRKIISCALFRLFLGTWKICIKKTFTGYSWRIKQI